MAYLCRDEPINNSHASKYTLGFPGSFKVMRGANLFYGK